MSEPTYRVDLHHEPHKQPFPWLADVVRLRDDEVIRVLVGESREDAFARALQWVNVYANEKPQRPSQVYLSEDGDLLDPAEVQR